MIVFDWKDRYGEAARGARGPACGGQTPVPRDDRRRPGERAAGADRRAARPELRQAAGAAGVRRVGDRGVRRRRAARCADAGVRRARSPRAPRADGKCRGAGAAAARRTRRATAPTPCRIPRSARNVDVRDTMVNERAGWAEFRSPDGASLYVVSTRLVDGPRDARELDAVRRRYADFARQLPDQLPRVVGQGALRPGVRLHAAERRAGHRLSGEARLSRAQPRPSRPPCTGSSCRTACSTRSPHWCRSAAPLPH